MTNTNDTVEILTQNTPTEGFVTYTAHRTERVTPRYGRVIEREVVGPLFIQDPNRDISSVLVLSTIEGGYSERSLMFLANGDLNWNQGGKGANIELRHSFARDVEADQSKLVHLSMASFELLSIYDGRMSFSAWLTAGSFYVEGDSGTGSRSDSRDILNAVERNEGDLDEDGSVLARGYENAGYPYMGPKRDGILNMKFPFQVHGTIYGAGYDADSIFRKAAGL